MILPSQALGSNPVVLLFSSAERAEQQDLWWDASPGLKLRREEFGEADTAFSFSGFEKQVKILK